MTRLFQRGLPIFTPLFFLTSVNKFLSENWSRLVHLNLRICTLFFINFGRAESSPTTPLHSLTTLCDKRRFHAMTGDTAPLCRHHRLTASHNRNARRIKIMVSCRIRLIARPHSSRRVTRGSRSAF